MSSWWCEYAVLPTGLAQRVLVNVTDGVIDAVTVDVAVPLESNQLAGLVLPGLANCHSHAFHRALRGHTQRERGSFWTWREQMYAVAAALTPDTYYDLARATYGEMALAGVSCVGEFHYLHHGPDGTPYADNNVMGNALIAAAADAGIRITLLDTCYVSGGVGIELQGPQLRFGDGDSERWASRVSDLQGAAHARVGAAIHSVRGVPAEQIPTVARWAQDRNAPLHVHLSEQRAENERCVEHYGTTPTGVLESAGALGPMTSAVHATHLSAQDITSLGSTATASCFCPTTERDLADGIGPARALLDAGSPLTLGSDSHAVIDLFEEARAVELNARLAEETRGHFTAGELLAAATDVGHGSLGWADAGSIAVGSRADLVAVSIESVRTAGFSPQSAVATAIFAATASDVTDVVVDGRVVVRSGQHTQIGNVGAALGAAIGALQ